MIAATGPAIDWVAALPLLVLMGASVLVLLLGLMRAEVIRFGLVPLLSAAAFVAAAVLGVLQWDEPVELFIAKGFQGAVVIDRITVAALVLVCTAGLATVLFSLRADAPRSVDHGEYYALLLAAGSGMVVLAAAQNLVSIFVGLELLSIPLYVLCAAEFRRRGSLESGLKYLIVGSLGSATFLYGLALLYGASGETDLAGVAKGVAARPEDSMVLAALVLTIVGLAFKASIAPFHQWTPDVYEGAPTPVTAFMAVGTKVAAFAVFVRLFNVGLIDLSGTAGPILAALAVTSIVVGNLGALGQDSLKRLLAWSSIAQAGYLLAGVLVATSLGAQALVFYLVGYAAMTLGAFAVVIARERESADGDHIGSLQGIGYDRPLLGWAMTVAMLGLAGMPATVGFIGKFGLVTSAASGGYTWLGVAIVVGSVISLAYYLRVVAMVWKPVESGKHAGIRSRAGAEVSAVAFVATAVTVVLGVIPGWALGLAQDAGRALGLL